MSSGASASSLYQEPRVTARFVDASAARPESTLASRKAARGGGRSTWDDDARTDIFVANDEMPNFFFHNLRAAVEFASKLA